MQTIFILIKLLILFSVSSWLILFSITPSFTGRQKQQKQEKTFHENNNNNNSNITTNKDICSISSRSNDCGYFGITEFECVSRNCCWRPTNEENANWCFYKDASHYTCSQRHYRSSSPLKCFNRIQRCDGYKVKNYKKDLQHGLKWEIDLELISVNYNNNIGCGIFGKDSKYLKVIVEHQTKDRLRVKIFDPYDARFEIPDNIVPIPDIELNSEQNQDINYNFTFTKDPFTFSIYRINNNGDAEKIIDTNVKNTNTLVFEDQFMEMSFELPDDPFIYGLGEIVYALRRNPNGTLQTIWTRDAPTPIDQNVYGAHPFYLEMRDGKAHGVVIGRSELPPYWSLGYHQSRWGYNNLSVLSDVVSRFRKENIPLETIWTDLDYMEGRLTVFPDWFNNETEIYWGDMIEKWLDGINLDGQVKN
ncbi:14828_t:CDS:2 [Entrophospora sp. SA101]|nr:14828_t:CDS:2 [Entrophospora sp. SA101]